MTQVKIRKMGVMDGPAVTELSQDLGYEVSLREVCERIGHLADDTFAVAFVGTVDGIVAGWIEAHDRRLVQSPRVLEIGGLVVAEEHRGSGVGRLLVESVGAWGRARNQDTLYVRSNVIRELAHEFYEKIGFERHKTSYTFSMPIATPEDTVEE